MVNTKEIRKRMIEHDVTYDDLGEAMGCASSTARRKVYNVRPMTLKQAEAIQKPLRVRDDEFLFVFFNRKSQNATSC